MWGLVGLGIVLFVLFSLILFYKFYFLRDPDRKIPFGDNIVSPADGKIMLVKQVCRGEIIINKKFLGKAKSYTGDVADKVFIVSIFMNFFDVHINRAPISGTVRYVRHSPGKFLNASTTESIFENENVQILIQQRKFRVKMIQIAGLVARRIVPFAKANEKVFRGQRIGIIKLGSQVTLIIPATVRIKVKEGERVYAGETIIAER
jgi:phosphatidylserine decarboxylase